MEVRTARTLLEVCAALDARKELPVAQPLPCGAARQPDLADVRGQAQARRALEIAAAGSHHLLFVGPPGSGKTLLASRLCGILPDPSDAEALEAATIASASGRGLDPANWRQRPFRAPHHTASAVALVGGGADPRPGEISLAHHGVLFLDELPEWGRHALEVWAIGEIANEPGVTWDAMYERSAAARFQASQWLLSPRARRATSAPVRPRPTRPNVLPLNSTPTNFERSQRPSASDRSASGMWRARASIRPTA